MDGWGVDLQSEHERYLVEKHFINALIVAVSRKKSDQLESTFGKLEQIWSEYEVYEPTDGGTES